MAIEKFTLASLNTMDEGRVREAFEQAMRRCEADCKDRPSLEAMRKIKLTVSMVPVPNERGELESVNVHFQVNDDLPERRTKTYNMKSLQTGLFVNELSPDDVNQLTLDQKTGELRKVGS